MMCDNIEYGNEEECYCLECSREKVRLWAEKIIKDQEVYTDVEE